MCFVVVIVVVVIFVVKPCAYRTSHIIGTTVYLHEDGDGTVAEKGLVKAHEVGVVCTIQRAQLSLDLLTSRVVPRIEWDRLREEWVLFSR